MKYIKYFIFSLLVVSMGCSSSQSISDQYSEFSLSDYKTFDFFEVSSENTNPEDFEQNIQFLETEIVKEMNKRGLSQSSESPDLKINLGIIIEDKIQTRTTSLATDPFMYSGQRSYTWESKEVPVNTYKEGSLTVHLVNTEKNEAVWVGIVSRVVPKKQKNKQKAITDGVSELFEKIEK